MKFITGFIDLFLYTSLLTACCATGLCMATEHLTVTGPIVLLSHLHVLVFGSTLVVYNLPRIARKAYDSEKYPVSLLRNFRLWYFVSFAAGAAMVARSIFWLSWPMILGCVALGLLGFMYSLPLLPFSSRRRLREYGWLKILLLASVWTVVTSVLPILYHAGSLRSYPFEILLRFVFIFTLCVIFDIRDVQTDQKSNIATLPRKVGLENSYRLINITLLLFALLSVIQYLRFHDPVRLASAMITAAASGWVVSYLKKHPTDRAYLALADGLMLVYTVLVIAPW